MRRLKSRRVLHGRDRERGAAAMLIAITMVALVGFTAIAVDVGRLYWERAELQNGADLAALSIAQACAKSPAAADCTGADAAATDIASRNALDAQSVAVVAVDTSIGRVQVDTAASEAGASANSVSLFFARIFGDDEAEVRAKAVARWGAPTDLAAKFPLAFSMCEIDATRTADGALQFLKVHGINAPTHQTDPCFDTSSGQEVPGGFGWLTQEPPGSCTTETAIGEFEPREPGSDPPSDAACVDVFTEWKADIEAGNQVVVLLPVFNEAIEPSEGDPGYVISAYAAIEVHGWIFQNNPGLLKFLPADALAVQQAADSSDRGFIGRFIRYVFTDEDANPGGGTSPYGTNIVKLTE